MRRLFIVLMVVFIIYIAYILIRKYWGKGYANEACSRMIEHLSSEFNVQVVRASMDTRNEASIGLAQSLGFSGNGTMPYLTVVTSTNTGFTFEFEDLSNGGVLSLTGAPASLNIDYLALLQNQ